MGLLDRQNLVHKNSFSFNLIKCGEWVCNVEPIYLNTLAEIQEFFIPSFTREWVVFQGFKMCFDYPFVFFIEGIYVGDLIDIDDDFKLHALISESGTYWPLFRFRSISSINRVSEPFRIRSLITSS